MVYITLWTTKNTGHDYDVLNSANETSVDSYHNNKMNDLAR